ncbi:MAG: hypothetical protein JSW58_11345 [Candidatus Latescibacterota bacterium]|nr:MAG: hypothetical protein JSW58_11345 [Candidatus Latescibacterota bacterium]
MILLVVGLTATEVSAVQMVTGTYEGDGQSSRPITDVGFQPNIVIIKGDINEPAVIRTATMPPNMCKPLGPATGLLPDRIKSLDVDGFTVGPDVMVNASSTTYYYVAIAVWPQKIEVGTYPGDHVDGRLIATGFMPTYVIIMDEGGEVAMQRFRAEAFDRSLPFDADDEKSDRIEDFLPTGFQIGTHNTVNETGHTYHYVAWKEHPNVTTSDVYPGDGSDNRDITAPGLEPSYVILTRQQNGSGTVHRPNVIVGDVTLTVDAGLSFTNGIQGLLPDGFEVGWDPRVNANGEDYFWVAFRGSATATQPTVAAAIPDTTVSEDAPPIDNYRDLNDVFDDVEDGSFLLDFTIEDNSNPGLVTATIDADSALDLSIAPSQTGFATIVVRATDLDGMFVEDTLTVTVIPNAPPALDLDADDSSGQPGADFATVFSEGDGPVPVVDNDATVIDLDSPNLDSLIVTLTNPLDGADEVLTANTGVTGISSSYSGGVLILSGPAPPDSFQQVLRTIVYDNTSPAPDRSDRVIEFVANDGEDLSNIATTYLSFCVQNVRDEFNDVEYDGNDGSVNWSDDWEETGEADGPASGIVQVSSNALRIGGNGANINNRGLLREADLSGAVSATLSYSYQRQLLGSPGGFIVVSISSDGGMFWSFLTFHALDGTDLNPVSRVFDITPFASPNTLIRFHGFGGIASSYFFADDVQIEYDICNPNNPPTVVSAIPDTTVTEDSPPIDDYRDLNNVFIDAEDGSALHFSIQSNSDPGLVTTVVDADSALDMSFFPDQYGDATIVVRATDSGGKIAEDTLLVTVTPSNDPPTVASAIPDTTVAEDSSPVDDYRDLNDVFTDLEDGSALTFTIEDNSNPSLVTAVVDPDSALDLGVAPNRAGSATIVIRATDSGALFAEDTLVVIVTQVNDPPTVASAIPDTIVAEDSPPLDNYRDLNDVFDDVEDGSALSFSVVSNTNPSLVGVTIDADSALDLSITAGQNGSAAVVVRATDSGALAVEDTFVVTVSSKVSIIDVAGSVYPSATFVNDPQLSLRIGVDNVSVLGVMLDTTSTIFFSDGINDYIAALANPTYVPPAADNFTLTFAPEPVPPGITAPAYYDFTLSLYGVDDASFPYADTVSTTGRNNIFIDTPKIRISAIPLDVEDVSPGQRNHPILLIDCQNGYPDERLLDSLVVTNVSFGAGTPAQLDGEIETVYLLDDVDSSMGLSPADTVVVQTVFASNAATFAIGGNWRISGSSRRALIVTVDIDSVLARDGDELDAVVSATSDVVFQGNTLIADDFSPLYPLDSFGRLVVNGMVSHQISMTPTLLDTLDSGSDDNWLFTVIIPQNGYEPDVLTGLSLKNYAPDTISGDLLTLRLYRDDGNGTLDLDVDEELGPLVHSGDRIQITGLNVPLSPTAVLFLTADVSVDLGGDKQFRPGIPLDGIEVESADDGPIDNEFILPKSFVLRKVDKIHVVNLPLGPKTPHPAADDVPMLLFSVENNTAQAVELDTLTLTNSSAGVGSLNDLDRAFAGLKVLSDDGNGTVDSWDVVVADQLVFTAGQLTAADMNISFSADEQKYLLVVADIDSFCASDGDTLRAGLTSDASLGFDTDIGITGVFPMTTPLPRVVDGMMAHQIELRPESDSLIVSGGSNVLLFEFGVSANAYQVDTLESVEIENLGSASSEHFELLSLYQDGGNGVYDGGSVDDIYHGDFSEDLATPGTRDYEIVGLALPLLMTCEQTTTFFVGGDISNDYTVGGSIQFSVPVMGIRVASGNDGPIDEPVEDPSVRVIPKPDQLTVFPYSVGDQIVYPGSEKNLNFGIGFYNGYSYDLTLDQLKLFQAGTASSSEIDSVFAYADIDTNGLFDPNSDSLVAASHSDGASYTLESIALTLPSEQVSYIFIGYDVPLHVRDSVSVDIKLFDEDGITVVPVNTDIEGEFPINSPGLDVTDGMVAKQVELFSVPQYRAAPGDQDVAAMSMRIPSNGIWPDRLDYVSIENLGSAVSGADIDNVRLWIEAAGDPDAFDPVDDQPLAFLDWNGTVWTNSFALNENIPLGGLHAYVSFSVSNTPTDGATFQANIPINGIQVTSGNDGPVDEAIANPGQQMISTDPLISELRADRSAYSVGQSLVLNMIVRNEGVDTLLGVSPAPLTINGSGSVSLTSGPTPVSVDLPPGEDSTITWVFSADIAGEITFCGFAHDHDSVVVSEQTCTATLQLHNRANTIPLSISNSAPASANRGQPDVPLFKLGLSYDDFDSLSAPVEFTGARLILQNGSGIPVPPNTILNKITFLNIDGTGHVFSLTDSTTNPLHLGIPDPTELLPGDSLVFNAVCEITNDAPFTSFRLSIDGLADIGVVDANDANPILLSTTETLPWRTTDIFVNERAESLLVSADTPQIIYANTGQEDVGLISLSLLNPGNPNTASEIITGLTLNFFDTTGSDIPPAQIIYQLDVRSGDQLLFTTQDIPSIGNQIVANLTTPFIVAPEVMEHIEVVVGLKDFPQVGAFYATVPGPHSIIVRDINNAQIVGVSAMDPMTIDFPFASNRILFENPASGLSASYVDKTPESILPSTGYVPIMDLILTHADTSLSSSLLVDSLALRFAKINGDPFFPGDYFSTLYVVNSGDTLSRVTSLSSVQPLAECKLSDAVTIAPATTETLSVHLDSKPLFAPDVFEARLSEQHIVVLDGNDGKRQLGISGEFPFVAGPTQLQIPSGAVQLGIISKVPQNVTANTKGIEAFDLVLENGNPPGHTPAELRELRVTIEDPKGKKLEPAKLLGGAQIVGPDSAIVSGQIDTDVISFDIPAGGVSVSPSTTDTLTFVADMDAKIQNVDLRFVIRNASASEVIDAITSDTLTVGTLDNIGYPLRTAFTHVLGGNAQQAFTNYPNPFAAGRGTTRITFYLDQPSTVRLTIYTVWGAPVRTLINNKRLQPGLHQDVIWDGQNGDGDVVNNGTYLMILETRGEDGSRATLKRKVGVVR